MQKNAISNKTMQIQPLKPWHLQTIELQPEQADVRDEVRSPEFYALTKAGLSPYALIHQTETENQVLICSGIQPLWQGRGMVWALLSKNAGPYMRQITWIAKSYLQNITLRRIEAYVRSDFKAGLQWMRLLGFEEEGHMHSFFQNGADAKMYALLKHQ